MAHTKGKLRAQGSFLVTEDGEQVAECCDDNSTWEEDEENAERFKACWNACVGLDTALVEQLNVKGFVEAASAILSFTQHLPLAPILSVHVDELRAALAPFEKEEANASQ